jgi:hypothetical protein
MMVVLPLLDIAATKETIFMENLFRHARRNTTFREGARKAKDGKNYMLALRSSRPRGSSL